MACAPPIMVLSLFLSKSNRCPIERDDELHTLGLETREPTVIGDEKVGRESRL
jgi:hypothetical protein